MLRSAMTGAGLPMPGRQAILREYARLAPGYDRRWSSYIQAGVRGTLARLGARPAGAVLDVGCGTGALLAALAQSEPPLGVRLAGLDPSPEMLAVARSKLATASISGEDRKSTRLNSSHLVISYAVFCLKKKQ